jgi:hypothetical protein
MNTPNTTNLSRRASVLSCVLLMLVANVARPGAAVPGEELAVLRAIAGIVNRDASRPYERLYFESQFEGASFVATSLENPDRNDFCGLSRAGALAIVSELETLTTRRVQLDKEIAKSAGLKIGRRKDPRFPYVVLSRVVFGPGNYYAWVAVELNGKAGSVMRLDKVDGEWKKTSRCGGWIKYGD